MHIFVSGDRSYRSWTGWPSIVQIDSKQRSSRDSLLVHYYRTSSMAFSANFYFSFFSGSYGGGRSMSTLSSSLLSWPSSAGLIFSAISKSYFAMYLLMLIAILLGPRFCKILTSCLSYLMPYKSVPSAMKIMIRSLIKLLRKSSSICLYFSLTWANYFLVCGSRAWIGFLRLARSNKGFSTLSSLI